MRPTTALNDNVVDLDALLHPGTRFEHPRDVAPIRPSPFPKSAPSWLHGLPTRPRSRPAPRCGRPKG
jgi:hypothetical protein